MPHTCSILATTPGGIDRFLLKYNAALNKWIVGHFANISAGSGTTSTIVISSNCMDYNLNAVLGTLGAAETINLVVAQGVVVESSSSGTPAMDLSGIISGCTVNLTNLGYIIGKGGNGGTGAAMSYPGTGEVVTVATNGQPGGLAIKGPGSGCTFNATNGSGHIWGGGGGGGGGGVSYNLTSNSVSNGGGGGAGAGAAFGGNPGMLFNHNAGLAAATAGGNSTSGVNGTFGAAGAAGMSGSGSGASNGGAGGDFGAAGAAGVSNAVASVIMAPGTAGAAGAAISLGGGTVTWISGSGSPNVKGAVS